MKYIHMDGFSSIVVTGWVEDQQMMKNNLVKMINDAGSKFNDYSILSKMRQILLHWGYELKTAEYYLRNKETIKEITKN